MSPKVSDKYKEQKKQEIIEAAKRVFRQQGYDLTSMEDIIENVQMSKGGVYHYFTGKEELFEAILRERVVTFDLFAMQEQTTNWAKIEYALKTIGEEVKNARNSFMPVIFEYFMRSYRDASREQTLIYQYNEGLKVWISVLEQGVAAKEFHPQMQIEAIARSIITFIDGMTCDAMQMDSQQLQIDQQIEVLVFYLRHVLQVDGSR
ncbi:TetR/AcrR family transcriptional regulator [Paenibacillus silviterrae]|uniref:TetR/AcrR family transcriptional regulator n=1 Tax=Paenibacillus silviterrae TaxID=3242194 RepID=UPI0025430795|nr:TetR family transcriptional regulator [Paenibacillus chinjuensis]